MMHTLPGNPCGAAGAVPVTPGNLGPMAPGRGCLTERIRGHVAVLLAAAVLAVGPATVAAAQSDPAIVTFTFDDASKVQHRHGLRIARALGIRGTIFVPTAKVNGAGGIHDDLWTMTWPDLQEFQAAGWEIGAHGRTHTRLTEMDDAAIDAELAGAIDDVVARFGVRPVSFSSPFGAFTDATLDRVMAQYRYHLSWEGHGGRNPANAIDPRYIGRFEVTGEMSSALVCGEMVRAAQTGTWLVLLFHGIVDEDPQDNQVSTTAFEEIAACARLLEDRGVIRVLTVRAAMEELTPPG